MKHRRAFKKLTKKIVKDLKKLDITRYDTEIIRENRSFFRDLFTQYGKIEETLIVTSGFNDYSFKIYVPMGKGALTLPYIMEFFIPVPMNGWAEYRHKRLRRDKWYTNPIDKRRIKDLKSIVPKPKLKHFHYGKKVPVDITVSINTGHMLSGMDEKTSTWVVHTGYEGGILSGGKRPFIIKYIVAVPKIREMLEVWNKRENSFVR